MARSKKTNSPAEETTPNEKVKSNAVAENVLGLIGKTPMVKLQKVAPPRAATLYAKLEMFNPAGSVKDRIALAMIEEAENNGTLKAGAVIVEPTSGNTGIGLAMVCAVKGYRCILTMPETMSLERRYILSSLGAEIELTSGDDGMRGAVAKAEEIVSGTKNAFMPQQFHNPANPAIHSKTTAEEIWEQTNGEIDVLVATIGTGGTITGISEALKPRRKNLKIIGVEPESSPLLTEGWAGPHRIQGIGPDFVPDVLNTNSIDELRTVSDEEAYEMSKRLGREEGLFVGISAGASTHVAATVAKEIGEGPIIVTILPDTGERYYSLESFFEL